jgi:hypothetical protein
MADGPAALRRLRLVKVLIQPVFVIEEADGTLSEPDQVVSPLVVKPSEWPSYATETFPGHVDALERGLNQSA